MINMEKAMGEAVRVVFSFLVLMMIGTCFVYTQNKLFFSTPFSLPFCFLIKLIQPVPPRDSCSAVLRLISFQEHP